MTKSLVLLLCALPLLAQDVVFRGTPTVRVFATSEKEDRQKLDSAAALKNECVIVQRGKKYFWASRNNAPMTRVDAPQFTYFFHNGGAGYVKVFTGNREAAKAPADYIETSIRDSTWSPIGDAPTDWIPTRPISAGLARTMMMGSALCRPPC